MKKLMFIACLLVVAISAQAQFERGKWVVNPSVTGLELSHNELEKTKFGFSAKGGAFLVDNMALLLEMGGEWTDDVDRYTLGVGGRYYFEQNGIYMGLGMAMNRLEFDKDLHQSNITDYSMNFEVGYAFFITKTITIEPAVYYNLSFKDSDYSKAGLKVGFGLYF